MQLIRKFAGGGGWQVIVRVGGGATVVFLIRIEILPSVLDRRIE